MRGPSGKLLRFQNRLSGYNGHGSDLVAPLCSNVDWTTCSTTGSSNHGTSRSCTTFASSPIAAGELCRHGSRDTPAEAKLLGPLRISSYSRRTGAMTWWRLGFWEGEWERDSAPSPAGLPPDQFLPSSAISIPLLQGRRQDFGIGGGAKFYPLFDYTIFYALLYM